MINPFSFLIHPGGPLQGTVRVPGDKSISHRALMLGAIAEGTTTVDGFLAGADCLATRDALVAMGVKIESPQPEKLLIHGVGLNGLKAPTHALDLGNSGTSIRLLSGLLAGQTFSTELTGDASLCRRPMARIVEPLRAMGAHIEMTNGNYPPLHIQGNPSLQAIHYQMPITSAQVKSGLLLAGLYAQGETIITEPVLTRDHTERLLSAFNYFIRREKNEVRLIGRKKLTATTVHVPADISSAAFFIVGATLAPDSDLVLENVGINPTRTGVIEILRQMGADIELRNQREQSGEPVADIHVRHRVLQGITIPQEFISSSIDEFPAIFIAAASAQGTTVLRGAAELRVKESDRIQTMVDGLQILGIDAQALPDGITITGGKLNGGVINSHGDHRVAMAFAMAGLVASAPIEILDCANVATSFPNFTVLARKVGIKIEVLK